jgi:hypothetical protein
MAKYIASDRVITQRRQEEIKRRNYVSELQREKKDQLFAEWENTTHDKILAKKKCDEVDQRREAHRQKIDEKRQKLAELLAKEQEEYERALDERVETQEQRHERLAEFAMKLKAQKEQERKELVEKKLQAAFRADCEALRAATSKAIEIQVAKDRKEQLEWNEQKRKLEKEDNKIFDEQWEQDRLKKIKRAQEDMERTKQMNAKLRENLDKQMVAYNLAKQRDKEIKQEEDRIYKEQIELALAMEAQKERERRAERVELGVQNKKYNEELRQQKAINFKKERDQDLYVLNDIIQKIKVDEESEQNLKRKNRADTRKWMDEIREQISQNAENQAEMERLWQLESDKEWAKRESQWKAQQDARNRLMIEVFEERALQLALKRQNVEDTKELQQLERRRCIEEMEAQQGRMQKETADIEHRHNREWSGGPSFVRTETV